MKHHVTHLHSYLCILSIGFCRGVPTDDLSVLKGCVSRNRAVFSPTSSVGEASIQEKDLKSTGTWPDLLSSSSSSKARYPPHLLSPSEPNLQCLDMSFSVSIQFSKGRFEDQSHKCPGSTSSLPKKYDHECSSPSITKNSISTPSGLNTSLRSSVVKQSHSNCSCVSQEVILEQEQFLEEPFSRTNSQDSQKNPVTFNCFKTHGKGKSVNTV